MYNTQDRNRTMQKSGGTLISNFFVYIVLPAGLAVLLWYITASDGQSPICRKNHDDGGKVICHPACSSGHFSIPGMRECQPWLTCDDIQSAHFRKGRLIGKGAVKKVYLAEWKGYTIVLNSLANTEYRKDFQHGLDMLTAFQQSQYVTQLLGFCGDQYITEYHRLGSATNINNILQTSQYKELNNIETRLGLCIGYAKILDYLHNSPLGTRVMCDSNYLEKTLSQYLLRSDLALVANDLDALPRTNRTAGILIRCGHRRIFGDFPAPEQRWPYQDHNFTDLEMPPYDEKTDIWKIPDVCNYFLDNVPGSDGIRFHLFKIHRQCKEHEPQLRPTAKEILEKYREVHKQIVT